MKPTPQSGKAHTNTTHPEASPGAMSRARGQDPTPTPASIPEALRNFDALPDAAGVRQPVVEALFACSSSTVWRRVASGLIPKPTKRGRTTVWNVGELRRALQGGA
jgi:predicted DNA-binding transcriptional regulator AlpA